MSLLPAGLELVANPRHRDDGPGVFRVRLFFSQPLGMSVNGPSVRLKPGISPHLSLNEFPGEHFVRV